jgi:tRNA U55 pseudouridine synthase TruB
MDGILNLDKPPGISSARAVDRVKRLLPRKSKIGHAGTLDPFATGVLVLLIGRGTKLCERLMDQPKQYEATIKFGATTATEDPESAEEPWTPTDHTRTNRDTGSRPCVMRMEYDSRPCQITPSSGGTPVVPRDRPARQEKIERALCDSSAIQQRPPAFSAMKSVANAPYKPRAAGEGREARGRGPCTCYGYELPRYACRCCGCGSTAARGAYIRSFAPRPRRGSSTSAATSRSSARTRVGRFSASDTRCPLDQAPGGRRRADTSRRCRRRPCSDHSARHSTAAPGSKASWRNVAPGGTTSATVMTARRDDQHAVELRQGVAASRRRAAGPSARPGRAAFRR